MTVSAGSRRRVVIRARAPDVVLNAGARPVIQRLTEAHVAGVAHMDEGRAFAAPFGDRAAPV